MVEGSVALTVKRGFTMSNKWHFNRDVTVPNRKEEKILCGD